MTLMKYDPAHGIRLTTPVSPHRCHHCGRPSVTYRQRVPVCAQHKLAIAASNIAVLVTASLAAGLALAYCVIGAVLGDTPNVAVAGVAGVPLAGLALLAWREVNAG